MTSPTLPENLRSGLPISAGKRLASTYTRLLKASPTALRVALSRQAAAFAASPVLGEMSLLGLWAILFASPYLNLDKTIIPAGREYASAIQTHFIWTRFLEHGTAIFWNGVERGGAPAFADLHGSMLHPLVIITTIIWGVVNGAKIALVTSFFLGGIGQWWLARVLGLGIVPRLWCGAMAIVSGHLASRMELGDFGVVLSATACVLVLPPLVALSKTPTKRWAVTLGFFMASALVAGQGYMQISLLFTAPAVLLLLDWRRDVLILTARRYALAAAIALLLAAPLLLPVLHFYPNLSKNSDATFRFSQPLAYVPLNLVIDDFKFYTTELMGKLPWPWLYANFIGWIPVLLAALGIGAWRNHEEQKQVFYLGATALLAIWFCTAAPLLLLRQLLPIPLVADFVAGVEFTPLAEAMAVPPILALSGIGLERLLRARWPHVRLAADSDHAEPSITLDLRWLLLIPLYFALSSAQAFNRQWVTTTAIAPEIPAALAGLRTPDLEWVNPPYGEHYWLINAVDMGLKLSPGIRGWEWNGRENPQPVLDAARQGPPQGTSLRAVVAGIPIYQAPQGREYASVAQTDGNRTICSARGGDGEINVDCTINQAGTLTIKENSWDGWQVYVNGQASKLQAGRWLAVNLLPGKNFIEFRYVPWDVPLGLFLCVVGLVLSAFLLLKKETAPPMNEPGA